MAAVTLSFSKVGSLWQTTTDSLGHMVLQIKRKGKGDITIEQYIDGMEPTPLSSHTIDDINVIIPFKAVRGLKIKITSTSEVEKAMIMEATYEKPSGGGGAIPENILTESDVINNLTSNETTKALSAAQGKVLKGLIPTAASTSKAGIVRQMNMIADPAEETIQAVKTTLISLLSELKTSLIMKNE